MTRREAVEVHFRSYELNPTLARESQEGSYAARLAKKYNKSLVEAEQMIERVTKTAKTEGLQFDYSVIRPGNTFDAHRLIHLAQSAGLQSLVKERFFQGYFCEGAAIGQPKALLELAVDAGLRPEVVEAVLNSDAYSDEVRADEREARELGISGVPFFVFGERYAVSGAQPTEVLRSAIERVLGE